MAVWIPGRKSLTTFGERFAPFNYGKNGKAFPSIATFTGNWEVSSPSVRNWTLGMNRFRSRGLGPEARRIKS